MDALNTFLAANVSLSLIALAAFFALRRITTRGEYGYSAKRRINLAGLSGMAMSVAAMSVLGVAFL
jgi:hypothetical protein